MLASPFRTPDATQPNPYYIQEEASDYDVPQGGVMFGVSGRGDRNALQGAQRYRAPQPDKPTPKAWQPSIDNYKKKVYGFLLDETKLPRESIAVDLMGAKSFSISYDTEFLCENIRFFTSHLRDHADSIKSWQLTITDAGYGCAGDSMQFLVAEYRDPGSPDARPEHIFSKVTGVDIQRACASVFISAETKTVFRTVLCRVVRVPNILRYLKV